MKILDKGLSDDVSLQELSSITNSLTNLVFNRVSQAKLESLLGGEQKLAEALSLVAGKGLRAGSQVEYEELSENIKTSKSMDLLEEKRWELVNLSKGLKIKEDRMCHLLLRAIEAKEASENEED